MALLTDGPLSAIADLQTLDSSILDTARVEGIDLDAKIAVAQDELELETAVFLLRTGDASLIKPNGAVDLRKAAVTPAMRRWHRLKAIAATYCDAYNSQLNDRYLGRWKHFTELAKQTAEALMELGVGIVRDPLPRPAAPMVMGSGTALDAAWDIRTAWRNAAGASSAASDAVFHSAFGGRQPVVNPGTAPSNATGWDVYAGLAGGPAWRQNTSPIAVGATWTMPSTGLAEGPAPGEGQGPDYYVRRIRQLVRG